MPGQGGLTASIAETAKKTDTKGSEYVGYQLVVVACDDNHGGFATGEASVWRRYSEFDLLRQYITDQFSAVRLY